MGIKIEGSDVKVLGGGTQAYNKDTTDKRRPLIMKSPIERQKALKRANDPEIQALESVISCLREDLEKSYAEFDQILAEKEEVENNLSAVKAELASVKSSLEVAVDATPKNTKKTSKSKTE